MGWRTWAAGMVCAGALAGCQPRLSEAELERFVGPVTAEEVGRVTSPDSLVDAVLARVSGNATVGFVHRVHLVPRGQHPQEGDRAEFLADQVEELRVVWAGPALLEIRYAKARIFAFTNFWQSREVRDFRHLVELRLAPTTPDPLPRPEWP